MLVYLKYCYDTEKGWHPRWESNPGPPVQPTEPTGTLKFQDCTPWRESEWFDRSAILSEVVLLIGGDAGWRGGGRIQ